MGERNRSRPGLTKERFDLEVSTIAGITVRIPACLDVEVVSGYLSVIAEGVDAEQAVAELRAFVGSLNVAANTERDA